MSQTNGQQQPFNLPQTNNPHLRDVAQGIYSGAKDNLQNNMLPGIRMGAMANGGVGGSRQGIAEGLAMSRFNQDLSGSIANMYNDDYQQGQNRATQAAGHAAQLEAQRMSNDNALKIAQMRDSTERLGMSNNYSLGLRGADTNDFRSVTDSMLGFGNLGLGQRRAENDFILGVGNLGLGQQRANNDFYTSQRGQDLNQMELGSRLVNQGNQGQISVGQGLYNNGQAEQAAPWAQLGNYAGFVMPNTTLGQTNTTTAPNPNYGSGVGGVLGGLFGAFR